MAIPLTIPYDDPDMPDLDIPIYVETDERTEDVPMSDAHLDALDDLLTPICVASPELALRLSDAAAAAGNWDASKTWLEYADRQSRWEVRGVR